MDCRLYLALLTCSLAAGWSAGQECGSHSKDEIRELRLEHLKTNIRAQLGLANIPEPPDDVPYPTEEDIEPELLQSYNQIIAVSKDVDATQKCTSDDFFAKPINSFIGHFSEGEFSLRS